MSFQLMSKKNFDIYLDLCPTKLSIAAFKKSSGHSTFFKKYNCVTNLNKDQLNFENAEKTIEKNIFEIEKKTGEFLNDIYLMVETPESISINLYVIGYVYNNKLLSLRHSLQEDPSLLFQSKLSIEET